MSKSFKKHRRWEEDEYEDEDEEDPFSDRNRWKRGVLEDPDTDSW